MPLSFFGFDGLLQNHEEPDAETLDAIFGDRQVAVFGNSGHTAYVSTAVLKRLGFVDNPPADPVGGSFGRRPDGSLNGRGLEIPAAMALAEPVLGAMMAAGHPLQGAIEYYALMSAAGITSTSEHTYKTPSRPRTRRSRRSRAAAAHHAVPHVDRGGRGRALRLGRSHDDAPQGGHQALGRRLALGGQRRDERALSRHADHARGGNHPRSDGRGGDELHARAARCSDRPVRPGRLADGVPRQRRRRTRHRPRRVQPGTSEPRALAHRPPLAGRAHRRRSGRSVPEDGADRGRPVDGSVPVLLLGRSARRRDVRVRGGIALAAVPGRVRRGSSRLVPQRRQCDPAHAPAQHPGRCHATHRERRAPRRRPGGDARRSVARRDGQRGVRSAHGGRCGLHRAGKLADFVLLGADPYEVDPRQIGDIEVLGTWLGGNALDIDAFIEASGQVDASGLEHLHTLGVPSCCHIQPTARA